MKKTFVLISSIVIIAACNNNDTSSKSKQDTTPPLSQTNNSVDILVDTLGFHSDSAANRSEKGSELIAKSDCLACHKVKEKLVGPAYTAVAEKYPLTDANINYLADKIIKGGKGVWGEIPMTPHPAISKADAADMVRYILSLRGIK